MISNGVKKILFKSIPLLYSKRKVVYHNLEPLHELPFVSLNDFTVQIRLDPNNTGHTHTKFIVFKVLLYEVDIASHISVWGESLVESHFTNSLLPDKR